MGGHVGLKLAVSPRTVMGASSDAASISQSVKWMKSKVWGIKPPWRAEAEGELLKAEGPGGVGGVAGLSLGWFDTGQQPR